MIKSFDQFVCLSGLPRSGSTLLSSILNQNPKIYAEGNSGICQLIWDIHISCSFKCSEQLLANNRCNTKYDILSSIPHLYYKDINRQIVVDKCRSWTIQENIELVKKYIDKNIKIIVLERPLIDIVKSFGKLYKKNNIYEESKLEKLLLPNTEPIMRSLAGVNYAKKNNQTNNFLFIQYDDLVSNPEETIKKIYDFCNWEYFEHDFNNIVNEHEENDEIYGLKGMHTVRSKICVEKNNIFLPKNIIKKCKMMDAKN